jgi:hypothetical protein
MKRLLTGKEGLTACLRFPAGHHHRIRHSSFIERTFGETRRRTKAIGRLPQDLRRSLPGPPGRLWPPAASQDSPAARHGSVA